MQAATETSTHMTEDLAMMPGLPKMRLRVSYDASGVSAEMITQATGSEPVHTPPTESDTTTILHHKEKKSKNQKQNDEKRIENAVTDMLNGMSARSAANKWDVPRTTLQNRKKAGFRKPMRPGPATILTTDEETVLCNWLIELSRRGIPVQKKFLLAPFVQNRPGKGWFKAFLRRHPNLAERYAEPISRGRGKLTENCIRGWFGDAERFFKENNCQYVMQDPTRQFNGDETGFSWIPGVAEFLPPGMKMFIPKLVGPKNR